jgi:cardiolipin synthase
MITSLPNLLTLSRIAVIPMIVALFFVDGDIGRWAACALFTAAAITDYFDGYLARARQQVSRFGRFLDPVADKLLVVTLIVMLVAFDRISLITVLPAIIIVCREIIVSGGGFPVRPIPRPGRRQAAGRYPDRHAGRL